MCALYFCADALVWIMPYGKCDQNFLGRVARLQKLGIHFLIALL